MQTLQPTFNQDIALRSLREKFARLIVRLGANNSSGTRRHEFEVEFCYATREFDGCPSYLAGKAFERVAAVCNSLDQAIKSTDPETQRG